MNLAIVLILSAATALAVILRLTIVRSLPTRSQAYKGLVVHPIDVEAFRNLTNLAEDEYLRRRLAPADFREVRRLRLRAMAAYIQAASENAAALIRVGQAALASNNPALAGPAMQLVREALLLRRNATIALARIYIALAWPGSDFAGVRVVDRYEQLSGSAMLLGRLQNPAVSVRLSARG